MSRIMIPAFYYQQFDADYSKHVPAEGYGGWKKTELPIDTDHTALVVMHAWDNGTMEQYPGWYRAVEYIRRAQNIADGIFPELLGAVRQSGFGLFHVTISEAQPSRFKGYARVQSLVAKDNSCCGLAERGSTESAAEESDTVEGDPVLDELRRFREANVFPGLHNQPDINRGFSCLNFMKQAMPQGDEPVAINSEQLFALCKSEGINHLIYTGFAIDGCLLVSPGGMVDMSRRGFLCSTIRQAVTAIENGESARNEAAKELALWRVALLYGFVYNADDFINSIRK